jgi:hypothetical protein
MRLLIALSLLPMWLPTYTVIAATISGSVVDVGGKPVKDARIDHIGKRVIVTAPDLDVKPSPDEPRTNAEGQFQITTTSPAIVIRKPGYESQRVLVTGDAQLQITLHPIKLPACKLERLPQVKTKNANDIDYAATWFYVETKSGPKGIISGHGMSYSWGAPSERNVWESIEYFEVMYESGVIDARGHTADGKYWRSQTIFGAAAQYFGMDQATAEVLDCVMDRGLVKTP